MIGRRSRRDTFPVIGGSRSYAVVWRKDEGPVVPGQLQLVQEAVKLRGGGRSQVIEHALRYDMLSAVRLGRHPEERIQGQPSLLLEVSTIERFLVSAIGGLGVVAELADLIAQARPLA